MSNQSLSPDSLINVYSSWSRNLLKNDTFTTSNKQYTFMRRKQNSYHKIFHLKKEKWEAGWHVICYLHIYDPSGLEQRGASSWLWSECLWEPFRLLSDLSSGMILRVICPAWPQLRKALGSIHFLVNMLFLLVWV